MTNFKGTKGVWKIDLSYKSNERVQIIDSNNNGFIDVWKLIEITGEEMQANAKLIACAPEMLEMLTDTMIKLRMNTHLEFIEQANIIEQLIKKAT